MASKYRALADNRRKQSGPRHTMNFTKIEGMVGSRLAASVRKWSGSRWDDDHSPASSHYQSKYG
jgi:hypothetical protein